MTAATTGLQSAQYVTIPLHSGSVLLEKVPFHSLVLYIHTFLFLNECGMLKIERENLKNLTFIRLMLKNSPPFDFTCFISLGKQHLEFSENSIVNITKKTYGTALVTE